MAFVQGEVDARATPIHNILTRNKDWIEKKLADFHAVIEVPKGDKHPQFPHLPDLETFAKSEREHKLLRMHRAFRLVGAPFFSRRARHPIGSRFSATRCAGLSTIPNSTCPTKISSATRPLR